MFSEKKMPGTLVDIAWNSPRISAGASGLGSNVSKWLGPPSSQIRMQLVLATPRIARRRTQTQRIDETASQQRAESQFQAVASLACRRSCDGSP